MGWLRPGRGGSCASEFREGASKVSREPGMRATEASSKVGTAGARMTQERGRAGGTGGDSRSKVLRLGRQLAEQARECTERGGRQGPAVEAGRASALGGHRFAQQPGEQRPSFMSWA